MQIYVGLLQWPRSLRQATTDRQAAELLHRRSGVRSKAAPPSGLQGASVAAGARHVLRLAPVDAGVLVPCGPGGGVASLQGGRLTVEPPQPPSQRSQRRRPLHRREGRGFGGGAPEGHSPAPDCRGSAAHWPPWTLRSTGWLTLWSPAPSSWPTRCCAGRGRCARRRCTCCSSTFRSPTSGAWPPGRSAAAATRPGRWRRSGCCRPSCTRLGWWWCGSTPTCARRWTCPTGSKAGTRSGSSCSMPTLPSTWCGGTRSACAPTRRQTRRCRFPRPRRSGRSGARSSGIRTSSCPGGR